MSPLTVPSPGRLLRIAAITTALGFAAVVLWFVYWDLLFVYSSNLGALNALDVAARRAEHRGDLAEAEAILRSSLAVQDRKNYKDPFGWDADREVWTHEHYAEVFAGQHQWQPAEEEYQVALRLAQQYRIDEPDYWLLVSDHGDLMRRAGRFNEAQAQFDSVQRALETLRPGAGEYQTVLINRALEVNAAHRKLAEGPARAR